MACLHEAAGVGDTLGKEMKGCFRQMIFYRHLLINLPTSIAACVVRRKEEIFHPRTPVSDDEEHAFGGEKESSGGSLGIWKITETRTG